MTNKTKRWGLCVALACLLAAGTAGAVLADARPAANETPLYERWVNRVAQLLGKPSAQVESAMAQAFKEIPATPDAVRNRRAQQAWRRAPGGQVTKVEGAVLTVQTRRGVRTVRLTPETQIREKGKKVTAAVIKVGDRVKFRGKRTPDNVVTAKQVRKLPPQPQSEQPAPTPGAQSGNGSQPQAPTATAPTAP
jgi:hypothetical protein